MIQTKDELTAVLSHIKRESQPTEATIHFDKDEVSYDEYSDFRRYTCGYMADEYGIIQATDYEITIRKTVDDEDSDDDSDDSE
jgi:hypothetical protein